MNRSLPSSLAAVLVGCHASTKAHRAGGEACLRRLPAGTCFPGLPALRAEPWKHGTCAWKHGTLAAILACLLLVLGGCVAPCPRDIFPVERIVQEYNANATAMPRLWARAKIAVSFPGPAGIPVQWGSTSPLATPNGLLLLAKNPQAPFGPHNFVLIGREVAAVELFRIGSSIEQNAYYMWYRFGDNSACWWGKHQFAGGPGVVGLPIDPNQLLAVLSVIALPGDLTQPPLVAVSMLDQPGDLCRPRRCEYVLTYIDRQPVTRKLLFRREIHLPWKQGELPSRPDHLTFLDSLGKRVMTATLDNYREVKLVGPGTSPGRTAFIPTDIRIQWPDRSSQVSIVLTEMSTKDVVDPEAFFLFDEDGHVPGIPADRVTQVDKHLEGQAK